MKDLTKDNAKRLELLTAAYLPLVSNGNKTATEALKEINFILGLNSKFISQDKMMELSIQLVKAELMQTVKAKATK